MLSFITANIREEKTFSDADWDALQEGLDRFSYGTSPAPRIGSKKPAPKGEGRRRADLDGPESLCSDLDGQGLDGGRNSG